MWRTTHRQEFYGGPYRAIDPCTHFDQSLVLVSSTHIASHLLRAHNKIIGLIFVARSTDDNIVSTASDTTPSSPAVTRKYDPSFQTSHEAGDGMNYLSHDTIGEHIGSTGGPLSHVQCHTRDK